MLARYRAQLWHLCLAATTGLLLLKMLLLVCCAVQFRGASPLAHGLSNNFQEHSRSFPGYPPGGWGAQNLLAVRFVIGSHEASSEDVLASMEECLLKAITLQICENTCVFENQSLGLPSIEGCL